jgi:hypothetical protein
VLGPWRSEGQRDVGILDFGTAGNIDLQWGRRNRGRAAVESNGGRSIQLKSGCGPRERGTRQSAEQQLAEFSPDFDVRDFDISPDGREVVLERVQERSNVVLIDLGKR